MSTRRQLSSIAYTGVVAGKTALGFSVSSHYAWMRVHHQLQGLATLCANTCAGSSGSRLCLQPFIIGMVPDDAGCTVITDAYFKIQAAGSMAIAHYLSGLVQRCIQSHLSEPTCRISQGAGQMSPAAKHFPGGIVGAHHHQTHSQGRSLDACNASAPGGPFYPAFHMQLP